MANFVAFWFIYRSAIHKKPNFELWSKSPLKPSHTLPCFVFFIGSDLWLIYSGIFWFWLFPFSKILPPTI
ncbi:hypothetical protein G4B88_015983 [Cannabis sativa]|nr:hypothetical protein G4B88_015983 [Cannabis sativa]